MSDQRQGDVKKWSDKWFKKLTPESKLIFLWLCDNVDCAGFMELDLEDIALGTGYNDLACVREGLEALTKAHGGSMTLSEGQKPYQRVIVRDGFCWIRNRVKLQAGSTDLRMKVPFDRGVIKRFLQNKTLFPEPLKTYSVDGSFKYPTLGDVRDYKGIKRGYHPSVSDNKEVEVDKDKDKDEVVVPEPDPDKAEVDRWKGRDEHYDKLVNGGVRMPYENFVQVKRGKPDVDWTRIVEVAVMKNRGEKLKSPGRYIATLSMSEDFRMPETNAEGEVKPVVDAQTQINIDKGEINKLYEMHKLSAKGVTVMHAEYKKGIKHDFEAYWRGEGELQRLYPMDAEVEKGAVS